MINYTYSLKSDCITITASVNEFKSLAVISIPDHHKKEYASRAFKEMSHTKFTGKVKYNYWEKFTFFLNAKNKVRQDMFKQINDANIKATKAMQEIADEKYLSSFFTKILIFKTKE